MRVFEIDWLVRFADTDPAGIVFYPRYFEMVNGVVESWFADEIGVSYHEMTGRQGVGTPTVHIEADFLRPSTLGETLTFTLKLLDLGRSSCTVSITASCKGEKRLTAKAVLVYITTTNYRARPFPEPMRRAMSRFLLTSADKENNHKEETS